MSVKSQKANMEAIYRLISQDLGYIFGEKESGPNGAKKEFLSKSAAFLRALGKDLRFKEMKVHTNPAGIAVSGEVTLYGMWNDGNGMFIEITQPISLNSFLYRNITDMNDHKGGQNLWISTSLFMKKDYETFVFKLLDLRKPTVLEDESGTHSTRQTEAIHHVA